MPEASRDRSLGTFGKTIYPVKRSIPLALTAVFFGAVGWLLGARHALSDAAAMHNAASLVFFTGIHQALLDGNVDSAKRTTEMAVSAHLGVIENAPRIGVTETINHFFASGMKDWPSHTLLGVYSHFGKQPDSLTSEAMRFLKSNAEKEK